MARIAMRKKPRKMEEAEMDITPMIDCTFLLLIFFIVTSNMEKKSPIPMPLVKRGAVAVEKNSVIISIDRSTDGSAVTYTSDDVDTKNRVGGSPSDQDEAVVGFIRDNITTKNKKDVIIKANKELKLRDVHKVMSAASQAEIEHLYIGVQEQK